MQKEVPQDGYTVSADPSRLNLDVIHAFLTGSYWARGISREVVERSIRGSICFGVYDGDAQAGFARVITDRATFAYLADVFILESHRGRGLSKFLMKTILQYPELQRLRLWCLLTRDTHGLYSQFGFKVSENPQNYMEIRRQDNDQTSGSAGRD